MKSLLLRAQHGWNGNPATSPLPASHSPDTVTAPCDDQCTGSAEFSVGARVAQLDAVIYCTGYEYYFPFLDLEALGLSTAQQHVAPLYQHLFAPGSC